MQNKSLQIAITGGSGLVGRMIRPALMAAGHRLRNFDYHPDWVTDLIHSRFGGPYHEDELASPGARADIYLGKFQRRIRPVLMEIRKCFHPDTLNIRSDFDRWVESFQGCDAVVHLAAIPHASVKGMTPRDYEMTNYQGAINIYQAAKKAGVRRFVYASSCQAYFINRFTAWRQFPIREEDADPIHSFFRPHDYGYLKWRFERFLLEQSAVDGMVSLALRLELPGLWGAEANNLFIQTSVENLQQAFSQSCVVPLEPGAQILNIADEWVPESLVNLPEFVSLRWQGVSYQGSDNSSLLSLDRAREILGYRPIPHGSYYLKQSIF